MLNENEKNTYNTFILVAELIWELPAISNFTFSRLLILPLVPSLMLPLVPLSMLLPLIILPLVPSLMLPLLPSLMLPLSMLLSSIC